MPRFFNTLSIITSWFRAMSKSGFVTKVTILKDVLPLLFQRKEGFCIEFVLNFSSPSDFAKFKICNERVVERIADFLISCDSLAR